MSTGESLEKWVKISGIEPERLVYMDLSQDIEFMFESFLQNNKLGYTLDDITAIYALYSDADYSLVWVTTDSRYYDIGAYFELAYSSTQFHNEISRRSRK